MLKPLNDYIVVDMGSQEDGEIIKNGIIITSMTQKEKPQTGFVIAIGNGRLLESGEVVPSNLKEGDAILFPKFCGHEIKYEGSNYLLIKESEILAVIN